jgi:hypothetical protein
MLGGHFAGAIYELPRGISQDGLELPVLGETEDLTRRVVNLIASGKHCASPTFIRPDDI